MGILIPGTTSWPEAIPVFLVGVLLIFVPGLVAGLLMRMGVLASLGVAPVLSTAMLAIGGILVRGLGVRWGAVPLVVLVLVTWLLAWLVGRAGDLLVRRSRLPRWVVPDASPGMSASSARRGALLAELRSPTSWVTLAGLAVAFALVCLSVFPEVRTPEAIPQHPDTIFHLAVPEWMLQHGTISALNAAGFQMDGQTGFYPAAFHGFTATIAMLTGSSVVVATETFVLALVGLAWPIGCVVLALTVFGRRPAVGAVTAVLSVAFTGFPYFLMGYGVLWPNLFGQALLPAALAAFLALRPGGPRPPFRVAHPLIALILVLAAVPALVLAHPNAFMSFSLFGVVIVLGAVVVRSFRLRATRPVAAVLAPVILLIVLAVVAVVLTKIRPASMYNTGAYGPEASAASAWKSLLTLSPRQTKPLFLLGALTGIGAVVLLLRHRGARWVVATLGIMSALYWLSVAVDTYWVRDLTWPWYNNSVRLQAVAVLPAALAATAAVLALGDLVARLAPRLPVARSVGSLAVLGVFVVATGLNYRGPHEHILHRYFHPKPADSWVSNQELRSLRQLSFHIPADAVVAANPWNGGTYLYIVSGRRLLVPTEKTNYTPDRQLLSKKLNLIGTDRSVCAAALREHVDWAITGGQPFSWAGKRVKQYSGVDSVGSSPAWQEVARAEPYTLYKRVACAR